MRGMVRKGQVFTLDVFLALVVMTIIIGVTVVAIDNYINSIYEKVEYAKVTSIAMDVASYNYYKGNAPSLTPQNGDICISVVRGSNSSEVTGSACQ